jgi:hypothetical protein
MTIKLQYQPEHAAGRPVGRYAFVGLDCARDVLWAEHDDILPPEQVGRVLRVPIDPALSVYEVNALLDDVAALASEVALGEEVRPGRSEFDGEGTAALEKLRAVCAARKPASAPASAARKPAGPAASAARGSLPTRIVRWPVP